MATDVDDCGHAGADHFRTAIVRHRFDDAFVQVQAGGNQSFAVSGRAGARDPRIRRQLRLNAFDDIDRRGQRAAFVGGVGRPYDFTVVVDQSRLDGGRTGVNTEEVRSRGAFQGPYMHVFTMVAGVERLAIRLGGEQWRHGLRIARQVLEPFKVVENLGAGARFGDGGGAGILIVIVVAGDERGTERDIQVGVGRGDELVDFAVEGPLERGSQLGHEEQRTTQENHGSVNRAPGGKACNGLRGHCGEDRCGQIRFRRAVVDQRLQIGFREHATA